MKTPREIILDRHRAAEEKLSGIDAKELASLASADANDSRANLTTILRSALDGFWRQAILPWRGAWAGLAALWVCVAVLNHAASGESPQRRASESAAIRNPQVISALREQNKMLVQLLDPITAPAPENLNPNRSGPRSERRNELTIA